MSNKRLFISYASTDCNTVSQAIEALRHQGLEVWVDSQQITAGADLVRLIDEGIREAKAFIIFASRAYFDREWTTREYQAAIALEVAERRERRIFVVRLDDSPLPPLLVSRRHIAWTTPEEVAAAIADALARRDYIEGSKAVPAAGGAHHVQIEWSDLDDWQVMLLLDELLEHAGDMLLVPGPVVTHSVMLTPSRTVTMRLSRAVINNAGWLAQMRALRNRYQLGKRTEELWQEQLDMGGLAAVEAGFTIRLEDLQRELVGFIHDVRHQLESACPSLEARPAES